MVPVRQDVRWQSIGQTDGERFKRLAVEDRLMRGVDLQSVPSSVDQNTKTSSPLFTPFALPSPPPRPVSDGRTDGSI